MKPSRDEIAAAIRAADIGGPGSTVDHEEAAENVLALLSQAGGSEAMKARCKEAVALWRGEVERLREALEACAACIEETGTWGLDALTKTRAALSGSPVEGTR